MAGEAWERVCALEDILWDTGVAVLYGGQAVAVFRVGDNQVFAIANHDPNSQASVLSRGLVGNLTHEGRDRMVVASPIYKQHFDLRTGECLEAPHHSVRAFAARADAQGVWLAEAVFETGCREPGPGVEVLHLRDARRGVHKQLWLQANRLLGARLRGDVRDAAWYASLIADAADVGAIRNTLLFGPGPPRAA